MVGSNFGRIYSIAPWSMQWVSVINTLTLCPTTILFILCLFLFLFSYVTCYSSSRYFTYSYQIMEVDLQNLDDHSVSNHPPPLMQGVLSVGTHKIFNFCSLFFSKIDMFILL